MKFLESFRKTGRQPSRAEMAEAHTKQVLAERCGVVEKMKTALLAGDPRWQAPVMHIDWREAVLLQGEATALAFKELAQVDNDE